VLNKGSFNLGRRETVSGHVDDVVDTAADPVVSFVVTASAVTGELKIAKLA